MIDHPLPPRRPAAEDLVIEGLAVTAVAPAERDEWEADSLRHLREMPAQVGGCTPQVSRAADAVAGMPLPPLETAEETDRAGDGRLVRIGYAP